MIAARPLAAAVAVWLSFATVALAQTKPEHGDEVYQPSVGQAGKDVIWVPTPDALVKQMLEAAKITKDDLVYDLGSGDGKIPIAAAKNFGARAYGIEYNPEMAELAAAQRAARRRREAGDDHHRRHLQGGLLQGDRRHDVPAARPQRQAAPDHPRDEAGHARDLAPVRHGRLGAGRDVLAGIPQRLPVDRAGRRVGRVAAARGKRRLPGTWCRSRRSTSASAAR